MMKIGRLILSKMCFFSLLVPVFNLSFIDAGWRDWFAWPQINSWRLANSHSLYERLRTVKPSTRNKALITGGVVVVGALAITGWRYWKNRRSGSEFRENEIKVPVAMQEFDLGDRVKLLSTIVEYKKSFLGKIGVVVSEANDGHVLRMDAEKSDDKKANRYIFLDELNDKDTFEKILSSQASVEQPDLTGEQLLDDFKAAIDFQPKITPLLARKMFIERVLSHLHSTIYSKLSTLSRDEMQRWTSLNLKYEGLR